MLAVLAHKRLRMVGYSCMQERGGSAIMAGDHALSNNNKCPINWFLLSKAAVQKCLSRVCCMGGTAKRMPDFMRARYAHDIPGLVQAIGSKSSVNGQ